MPWDATTLWVAELDGAGMPGEPAAVDSGAGESLVQPEWAPDGRLYVMSDRSDFWSLYRVEGRASCRSRCWRAELAGPLWQLGARWYDFVDADTAWPSPPGSAGRGWFGSIWQRAPGPGSSCRSSNSPDCAAPGDGALVQALPDDGPGCIILLDAGRAGT